ncbi:MAG: cysteine--tRNA ligase [Hyphomicrobiales bacterium]
MTVELTLYNTLSREKASFIPIDPENVRLYVCGPTVYDFAHIGNARPVIVFDLLARLLRHVYGDKAVTYVRNITDVDDKINARALENHGAAISSGKMSLNEAIREVTEKTANQFMDDMGALGCLDPDVQPRATENIEQMIQIAQTLIDKGHAYVAKGGEGNEVLFSVDSMTAYGALSNRKLDEQQAGARVAVESHKENPADFVLWKQSDDKAPGWNASFAYKGETIAIYGRPGWHIECSAMSERYLGKTFDIHGGGIDLVFPHHENEIAQSCCAFDVPSMANVWMHNGFLQVEGEKMSKSLGNFITVYEVLHTDKVGGRQWAGEIVRLAMLMTHYREPIDFSVKRLEEAENLLVKMQRRVDEGEDKGSLDTVIATLHDDLNSSAAIHALNDLSGAPLREALEFMGLPASADTSGVDEAAIASSIAERLQHFKDKNWGEADRIRDELLADGIQLKDGKDADTGERVTTWELKR